jgi:hypothetical protein
MLLGTLIWWGTERARRILRFPSCMKIIYEDVPWEPLFTFPLSQIRHSVLGNSFAVLLMNGMELSNLVLVGIISPLPLFQLNTYVMRKKLS